MISKKINFGDILLVSPKNVVSRIIRWKTNSMFTHAGIFIDSKTVVEAAYPKVRKASFDRYLNSDYIVLRYDSIYGGSVNKRTGIKFLDSNIGKKYDLHKRIYYSSELVKEFFEVQGINISTEGKMYVSPDDINNSMLFKTVVKNL